MESVDRYCDQFRELSSPGAPWLLPLRESALQRFTAQGFPTTRDEEWRYTSVRPISGTAFAMPAATFPGGAAARLVRELRLERGAELVFVNARFAPDLSRVAQLPAGALLCGLAEALETESARIEPYLGRQVEAEKRPFVALNTAFLADGALLYLPPGAVLADPVHLIFLTLAGQEPVVTHPRVLIVAERESSATVIETFAGEATAGGYFSNAVTEIAIGAGASVTHIGVQCEAPATCHMGSVAARQERDSRFQSYSISLGAALARREVDAIFMAPGGECTLDGLYVGGGSQHMDHHTMIDHRREHCTSHELYKGILDGHSRGVFNGKVYVHRDAQKSDAHQSNQNLLLSPDAVVNTKPQLEIFADDVRCSHGATIGRLADDALFYLRSRGVDAAAARQLLIHAFANQVIERLPVAPLRARLDRLVRERFRAARAEEKNHA